MTKIYKSFQYRFKESWYQLSQEERRALVAKVVNALESVGGKSILMCHSGWSTEEWLGFGVGEYPDIEAVQTHTRLLHELNWFRYLESRSILGTEAQPQS
ncbi:MAG TPA: hypothetical protein P5121_35450 [Caldilineaceae bacterium]|nr:hypothetical protein [Caldilineaceae bacterium]